MDDEERFCSELAKEAGRELWQNRQRENERGVKITCIKKKEVKYINNQGIYKNIYISFSFSLSHILFSPVLVSSFPSSFVLISSLLWFFNVWKT